MGKEQIEKMAKDIFESGVAIDGIDHAFAAVHGADMTDSHFMRIAQHLYNAGYRKQRVGEWIWTENGEADHEKYWVCSVCKEHDFVRTKYCPNCGAKMRKEDEGK